MQRIERYGVIALVFLLVTIVAVSLWGEQRKGGGLFQFLRRDSKNAQIDRLVADAPSGRAAAAQPKGTRDLDQRLLPLSEEPEQSPLPPAQFPPQPLTLPGSSAAPSPTDSGLPLEAVQE